MLRRPMLVAGLLKLTFGVSAFIRIPRGVATAAPERRGNDAENPVAKEGIVGVAGRDVVLRVFCG